MLLSVMAMLGSHIPCELSHISHCSGEGIPGFPVKGHCENGKLA